MATRLNFGGASDKNAVYMLSTADGSSEAYAQLESEERVELTAEANDIRLGKNAVTSKGVTDGTKEIPGYQSVRGVKLITANTAIKLSEKNYNYTKFQATIALFNSNTSDSVQVDRVTVDDAVYQANSTTKLSDLTKDHGNKAINFGITNGAKSVMRYLIMREEA